MNIHPTPPTMKVPVMALEKVVDVVGMGNVREVGDAMPCMFAALGGET